MRTGTSKADAGQGRGHSSPFFRRNPVLFIILLGVLLLVSALVSVLVGTLGPIGPGHPERISFSQAVDALFGGGGDMYVTVFWELRIPRVLLAGLVGASLACAGTAMQAVFRNPMADPFIIGVSSGAAVGASSAGLLGLTALVGVAAPALAFVCALATVMVVYKMGTVGGRVYVDTLLLSGVALAAFLGAVVSFLIYFAGEDYHQLIPWLLGSLAAARWSYVAMIAVPAVAGTVTVLLFGRELNALLLGEETAHNLGADPEFLKKIMLMTAALMTAGAVAFCGIIGFVGLIVPHMMRIVVGADHRKLIPAATLFGASFLIWADALSRTVIQGEELPVGIITALCGGPFFLYLLRRSRGTGVMS
ncbi:MAG: iron chelate uptake ABC transporter family permease subunit [Methanobacteriota archaeon]|nr:MAG: iron chelate uptake ABC transporter family permease subunit [Euryarchaeota archaeon]